MIDALIDSIPGWVKYLLGFLSAAAVFVWRGGIISGQTMRDFAAVQSDIQALKAANVIGRIEAIGKDIRTLMDSGLLKRFESVERDVSDMKAVVYREHGKLNVMTEDRHTEVCGYNSEAMEKDLESLKTEVKEVRVELKEVKQDIEALSKLASNLPHIAEIRAMRETMEKTNQFMEDISAILNKALKVDRALRVPHNRSEDKEV